MKKLPIPPKVEEDEDEYSVPATETKSGLCRIQCMGNREDSSSWLLVIRVMLYNVIEGLNYVAFSVMYVDYSEHFQQGKATLGWIVAIQVSTTNFLGIFVTWPIEKWGCARMAFVGSLMSAFGLSVSALSPSVLVLYVTQGFITGAGLSLTQLSAGIIIQRHFSHNRALATGLVMLGFSTGCFMGPPLVNYALDQYGWRGALLLLGALKLQKAPLGLTFWQPRTHGEENKAKKTMEVELALENKEENMLVSMLKHSLDFSLFKYRPFLLFCVAIVSQKFSVISFFNHLPSYVVSQGLSLEQGAFLASMIGFCSTGIRVIIMVVSNQSCVNRLVVYTVGVFAGCLATCVLLLVPGYYGMFGAVSVFGIQMGIAHTIETVAQVDIVGVKLIGRSMALTGFFIGCINLLSTPLCGWLYDITSDYRSPYLVMGLFTFNGAVFSLLCLLVQRCEVKKDRKAESLKFLKA